MTITEFLNGNTIPADAITAWTDRKGVQPDHVTARCGFLRKHLAAHLKDAPVPEDTTATVSREKVGDFGLGELIVLSTGARFAAAAGAFRVLDATTGAVPAAPATETPVAEAAAPAKPKAKRVRKAKTPKAVPAEEVAPEVVQAAIEKVFDDAKDVPFMPDPEDVSDLDA